MKLNEIMDDLIYLASSMDINETQLQELLAERYAEISASPDYKTQLAKLRRRRNRTLNQLFP